MSAQRKIRVAILADFPLSSLAGEASGRGGGQSCTWLPQLALAFQNVPDLDIHWVVLDRNIFRTIVIEALGQHFHRVPSLPISADLALNYWPARVVFKSALRRIRPDVLHVWGTEMIYPAALRDFEGPTILSMQGMLTEYHRIGGLPGGWRMQKMIRSEPGFLRSATVVTSESQWGVDRIREIAPQADCRMVEYGVHPGFYEMAWEPDPERPYALYVGGSGTRKGFDVLVEAIKMIPDRRWELRLAGDATLQEACSEAHLHHVTFLGVLPWKEMKQHLKHAWLSVLPTRADTSPNSVKEARVIGLPVVTTSHGGQTGYIFNGVNGRIVDPLTPANLAGALSDMMGSFDRVVAMGRARHREDREYLHPGRTAQGFEAIYREQAVKSKGGASFPNT